MFDLVPFKKEHLEPLMLQKMNAYLPGWVKSGQAAAMEGTYAFTGLLKGDVAACGGVVPLWEGRGQLWSIYSEAIKTNFLPIFRGMQKFLDSAPFARIEMAVPCEFELGHRRAKMLGFELECPRARHYLANGEDCSLYARIRQVGLA